MAIKTVAHFIPKVGRTKNPKVKVARIPPIVDMPYTFPATLPVSFDFKVMNWIIKGETIPMQTIGRKMIRSVLKTDLIIKFSRSVLLSTVSAITGINKTKKPQINKL